jgi:hypothetical protein
MSIVGKEGFILWFDNTRNRLHTLTIKIALLQLGPLRMRRVSGSKLGP